MGNLLELTALAEPTHFWFHGLRSYVVPVIDEIAGGRRDLRIIDCGCGTGYNLEVLLRPYGPDIRFRSQRGFDVAGAQRRGGRLCGPIWSTFRLRRTPSTWPRRSMWCRAFLTTARRCVRWRGCCRPGGHVVLNVTALDILRGDHSDVWGELRRYNTARASRLLADAGLEVVRISYLFASLLPLMLAVRKAQAMCRPFREPKGDADLSVPSARSTRR